MNNQQESGSKKYVVLLALAAGMGGLLYGYDTISISGAIGFLKTLYSLSATLQGFIISSIMIGGVIGVAFSGFLSDRFGRKSILMLGGIIFTIAAIWSAFTQSPAELISARIFGGTGIGLASSLAVTYITESAPPKNRGALSSLYQLLTIIGIFLTNFINFFIASIGTPSFSITHGWRWMLGIGAIPAILFILSLAFSPESPRFLIQSGKKELGYNVLKKVNGTKIANEELKSIEASIKQDKNASLKKLFQPGLRTALFIGIFLAIFNQAIGMNAISYYVPEIFKSIGFGGNSSFLASAIVGSVELVFTIVATFTIDQVGRKPLMLMGMMLMAIFAAGMSWAYIGTDHGIWLLAFVLLFTAAFAFSMGPIPWIMIPELFPTYMRARAAGICTVFLWGTNWAIGFFTPIMLTNLGGTATFGIFAILNVLGVLGVAKFVPETKGKTLEEIQSFWKINPPISDNE